MTPIIRLSRLGITLSCNASWKKLVLVAAWIAILTTPLYASHYQIIASTDATVKSAKPTQNFGSELTLFAGYSGTTDGNGRTFLSFDLSSIPPQEWEYITDVYLYMNVTQSSTSPYFEIWTPGGSWNQGTITWSNMPSLGSNIENTGSWSSTGYNRIWLSRNGNAWIRNILKGISPNYGLVMRNGWESSSGHPAAYFTSRENASSNKPMLDVWTSVAPTPSITVTTPAGGEQWQRSSTYTIRWSSANILWVDKIQILYSPTIGGSEIVVQDNIPANYTSTQWTVPADAPLTNQYRILAKAIWHSGTVAQNWSQTFTIGQATPTTLSFNGTVTNASNGSVISGASVQWGTYSTSTDANGYYAFTSVACQTNDLIVSKTGFQTYTLPSYTPTCGGTSIKNVQLTPNPTTLSFNGTVTSAANGNVISGASVQWGTNSTTTDVNGHYAFTSVPCQTNDLIVSKTGFQSYISPGYSPTCGGSSVQDVQLTPVSQTATISGTITDANTGSALSGATIQWGTASTLSGVAGSYSLTALPCGTNTLTISKSGYETWSETYSPTCPGQNTRDIVLSSSDCDVSCFCMNFASDDGGLWSIVDGTWSVENGSYSGSGVPSSSATSRLNIPLTDGSISFDATVQPGSNTPEITVGFRNHKNGDRYEWINFGWSNTNSGVIKYVSQQASLITNVGDIGSVGRRYHFQITLQGNHIILKRDGVVKFDLYDNGILSSGSLYLHTYDAHVHFDNMQVCGSRAIRVTDAKSVPVANQSFKVYKVAQDKPMLTETLLGSTDVTSDDYGFIDIPQGLITSGDWIKVSKSVYAENACRHTAKLPTRYQIVVDNGVFDNSSSDLSFDSYRGACQLVSLTHTTVVFDLLVSVEWDADEPFLNALQDDFREMSSYLYDVFDGQLRLGTVSILDNDQLSDESDIHICAENTLRANAWGGAMWCSLGSYPIQLPRRGFCPYWSLEDYANNAMLDSWLQISQAPVIAHEFGHHALSLWDEYLFPFTENGRCKDSRAGNYGYMDYPCGALSEMSSSWEYTDASCQNTKQWKFSLGAPCWWQFEEMFERSFGGIAVSIIKPEERHLPVLVHHLDGPNDWNTNRTNYDVKRLVTFPEPITAPQGRTQLALAFRMAIGDVGIPYAEVYQLRGDRFVYQGHADKNGNIKVLGFVEGDKLYSTDFTYAKPVAKREFAQIENTWLSGVSTESPLNGEPLKINLLPMAGPLFMLAQIHPSPSGYSMQFIQPHRFVQTPILQISTANGAQLFPTLTQSTNGFETTISGDIGTSGYINIFAKDDSGKDVFAGCNYSTTTNSGFVSWYTGPDGDCDVLLDSVNNGVRQSTLLSSAFPPPSTGLSSNAVRVGRVHSIDFSPLSSSNLLEGYNLLKIHYFSRDIDNGGLSPAGESSLEIYRWNVNGTGWQVIGGNVDTVNKVVAVPIDRTGTYAVFSSTCCVGLTGNVDCDLEDRVDIADLSALIDNLYISFTPLCCPAEADTDGQLGVDIADLAALIDYLYISFTPTAFCH